MTAIPENSSATCLSITNYINTLLSWITKGSGGSHAARAFVNVLWILEAPLLARSEEWFEGLTMEDDAPVRKGAGCTLTGSLGMATGALEQGEDRVSHHGQKCVKENNIHL